MATTVGLAAAFQELGIAHRRRCGQGSAAAIIHTLRGRRAQVGPLLVLFLRTLHNLPHISASSWCPHHFYMQRPTFWQLQISTVAKCSALLNLVSVDGVKGEAQRSLTNLQSSNA